MLNLMVCLVHLSRECIARVSFRAHFRTRSVFALVTVFNFVSLIVMRLPFGGIKAVFGLNNSKTSLWTDAFSSELPRIVFSTLEARDVSLMFSQGWKNVRCLRMTGYDAHQMKLAVRKTQLGFVCWWKTSSDKQKLELKETKAAKWVFEREERMNDIFHGRLKCLSRRSFPKLSDAAFCAGILLSQWNTDANANKFPLFCSGTPPQKKSSTGFWPVAVVRRQNLNIQAVDPKYQISLSFLKRKSKFDFFGCKQKMIYLDCTGWQKAKTNVSELLYLHNSKSTPFGTNEEIQTHSRPEACQQIPSNCLMTLIHAFITGYTLRRSINIIDACTTMEKYLFCG